MIAGVGAVGCIAASGGGGAPTPDGFLEYIASLGVDAGQATWTSQGANTAQMVETGSVGLNSADADFNGEDSLDFPGAAYYQIDETQLSRANQRWVQDGTTDWWNYNVILLDAGGDEFVWSNQSGTGTGCGVFVRTGSGFARLNVYDSGALVATAPTPNGSIPIGSATIIFTRHVAATGRFGVRALGGTWVESGGTAHPSGDSNGPLTLFANANASLITGGKLAKSHFRKSLPADEAAIEAALVAQFIP